MNELIQVSTSLKQGSPHSFPSVRPSFWAGLAGNADRTVWGKAKLNSKHLCHLLVMGPQAGHVTSLHLSSLT